MKSFIIVSSLLASTGVFAEEKANPCFVRTICTMDYQPTECRVKGEDELRATGSNNCQARAALKSQLCRLEIEVSPEDIVCSRLYPAL